MLNRFLKYNNRANIKKVTSIFQKYYYSSSVIPKAPLLINGDTNNAVKNATICHDQALTSNFHYLSNFVNKT